MARWRPTTLGIASVWDWDRLEYDYYQIPEPKSVGGWLELDGLGLSRSHGAQRALGVSIEMALRPLPVGSRWLGRGAQAQGEVMRRSSAARGAGLGQTGRGESGVKWAVIVALAAVGALVLHRVMR